MTVSLTATGLQIQTYDEILDEVVDAYAIALELTPTQKTRVRNSVQSKLGNLARIDAEREAAMQEALLAVYETLSLSTEGQQLETVAGLLGVTRDPAVSSEVVGTASGVAATNIPNGTRLRYDPDLTTWTVIDGPYVIGGGGTVEIRLASDDEDAVTVALDPDVGFDDWTILDAIVGFNAFESTQQPITGAPIETDASLRQKVRVEAYSRGQGPLRAIEARVSQVEGVTFVRAYENRTLVTDANSIPGKAINVVVDGGLDADVAEAIFRSRSAGAEVFALAGPTYVGETVIDDYGFSHLMPFNRVETVDLWVRVTLTTSTSETTAPVDLISAVEAELLAELPTTFGFPGTDVLPYKISQIVAALALDGIDAILVETSLDGVAWTTTKRSLSIRQKAAFDAARIEALEA